MANTVKKVVAYNTRGDELLVFTHREFPEAGVQVPAGTVEEGETLDAAVLREVHEETGLPPTAVRKMAYLGRREFGKPDPTAMTVTSIISCSPPLRRTRGSTTSCTLAPGNPLRSVSPGQN